MTRIYTSKIPVGQVQNDPSACFYLEISSGDAAEALIKGYIIQNGKTTAKQQQMDTKTNGEFNFVVKQEAPGK